jgi:hypothetical protein
MGCNTSQVFMPILRNKLIVLDCSPSLMSSSCWAVLEAVRELKQIT